RTSTGPRCAKRSRPARSHSWSSARLPGASWMGREPYPMKYMLLVYGNEQAWAEPAREHCSAESLQLVDQLKSAGQYLAASPLHPTSTATSVRIREGERLVTGRTFAETR